MHSGIYVDVATMTAIDVDLDDIACGLGSCVRFNGQTSRLITVAEHSQRVRRLAIRIATETNAPATVIAGVGVAGLHHDDHEAYMPWGDCLGPGKTAEMREAEDHVQALIWDAFGWYPPLEVKEIVRQADLVALYFEATLWKPRGIDGSLAVWPGAVSPTLMHVLLPDVAPAHGETLADALSMGRWCGESWATSVNTHRPRGTKPWPGSRILSGERSR